MNFSSLTAPPPDSTATLPEWLLRQGRVILVETPGIEALLPSGEDAPEPVVTRLDMIGPEMLRQVQPMAVIAPLISGRWDITDLALRLEAAEFGGRLLAVSEELPRAGLVLNELRNAFPGLRIELMEMPASSESA